MKHFRNPAARGAPVQAGAALVGLVDSIYLAFIKLTNAQDTCLPGVGDCASVNNSLYSEIFGIPIAILGAGAYFAILMILLFEFRARSHAVHGKIGQLAPILLFGLTLTGTIYSVYLTYLEFFVLKAVCPFCLVSAVAMVILFVVSVARLLTDTGESHF